MKASAATKILARLALLEICFIFGCYFLVPEPAPESGDSRTLTEPAWVLPNGLDEQRAQSAFSKLTKQKIKQKTEPAVTLNWRFLGLVKIDGSRVALVESEQGLSRLRVGDSLPDGSQLTNITDDSLEIRQNDEPRAVKLYTRQEPRKRRAKKKRR